MKMEIKPNEKSIVLDTWEEVHNLWAALEFHGNDYELVMYSDGSASFNSSGQVVVPVIVNPIKNRSEELAAKDEWNGSTESRHFEMSRNSKGVDGKYVLQIVMDLLSLKSTHICLQPDEYISFYLTAIEDVLKAIGKGDFVDYVKNNILYTDAGNYVEITKNGNT